MAKAKAKAKAIETDRLYSESMASLRKINATLLSRGLISLLVGLLSTIVGWFVFGGMGLIGGIAIGGMGFYWTTRFTSTQYYEIQHSTTKDGKHRCVHCGHTGIYIQGEYKSENKHSSCSKCKTHLFTD